MNERRGAAPFSPHELRRALLAYFRQSARDLPWRGEKDPYRVWVSEVMLQQTQVVTVADRYGRFIDRFPTLTRLAGASDQAVCEAWAGLGFYRRARSLHAAATLVKQRLGGRMPRTAAGLRKLPGVGAYTAGAVASIAFGEAVPAVDGNVARVLSRVCRLDEAAETAAGRKRLFDAAQRLVEGPRPGDLNQALMELGALVCRPTAPKCDVCPIERHCAARAAGVAESYPTRSRVPAKRPLLAMTFAWIEDPCRGVWLERRPQGGLWAGQWQLPGEEGRDGRARLAARLGVRLDARVGVVRHDLSHRRVRATVFAAQTLRRLRARSDFRPFAEPRAAPVSALARRAIAAVVGSQPNE